MVIMECASYALALGGDACASDGPSAADAIFILMATACLPAALEPYKATTARIRRLGACVGQPGGSSAWNVVAQILVYAVPTATARQP